MEATNAPLDNLARALTTRQTASRVNPAADNWQSARCVLAIEQAAAFLRGGESFPAPFAAAAQRRRPVARAQRARRAPWPRPSQERRQVGPASEQPYPSGWQQAICGVNGCESQNGRRRCRQRRWRPSVSGNTSLSGTAFRAASRRQRQSIEREASISTATKGRISAAPAPNNGKNQQWFLMGSRDVENVPKKSEAARGRPRSCRTPRGNGYQVVQVSPRQ
jgi:hypothetical protein